DHIGLDRVEGVRCVGEALRREISFQVTQERIALGFAGKRYRYAAEIIRRLRWRSAEVAAAQPAQSRQCRPTHLIHHCRGFARDRSRKNTPRPTHKITAIPTTSTVSSTRYSSAAEGSIRSAERQL